MTGLPMAKQTLVLISTIHRQLAHNELSVWCCCPVFERHFKIVYHVVYDAFRFLLMKLMASFLKHYVTLFFSDIYIYIPPETS